MKRTQILFLTLAVAACSTKPAKDDKAKAVADEGSAVAAATAPTEGTPAATPAAAPPTGDIPAPEDVAAAPADAVKTASGLASKVLKPGTGTEKPGPTDTVEVHYTGWTTDGKMFDSSVARGEPTSFPLNGVIKGWTEGVGMMVAGEKRRFWIPGDLAYGETPSRPGAPAGTLVFDVELLSIKKAPSPEELEAQFSKFEAALKIAVDKACECKDVECLQTTMMGMRELQPTAPPTQEQMAKLGPYMEKVQACAMKLMPAQPPAGQ